MHACKKQGVMLCTGREDDEEPLGLSLDGHKVGVQLYKGPVVARFLSMLDLEGH